MNPDSAEASERDTLRIEDEVTAEGFVMLPKRVMHARNLSHAAKYLYAVLLDYAWQDERCFPGYARLCDDMGASEPIVRKYMRELETVGLLHQKRRGLGKTNLYTLLKISSARLVGPSPPPSRAKETSGQEGKGAALAEQNIRALLDRKLPAAYKESEHKDTEGRRRRSRARPQPAEGTTKYTTGRYGHLVET